MSAINLLPWREAVVLRRNRFFCTWLFITVSLTLSSAYCGLIYVDKIIVKQQDRNQFLRSEIRKLDRDITQISLVKKSKNKRIEQIVFIRNLQEKRNYATALFNTLSDVVPADVYLNSVTLSDGKLDIKGAVTTNPQLTKIVKGLNGVDWLQDAYIRAIFSSNSKLSHLNKFEIQATVKVPFGVKK